MGSRIIVASHMPPPLKQQGRLRPVVIQAGGIGDMVMVTPLMACLHERYGKAPYLACSHAGVPEALFEGEHPHLGGLVRMGGWKKHYWLTPRQWKFVDYLRHGDAGPIYVCDARREKVAELLERGGVAPERCLYSADFPEDAALNRYVRYVALGRRTPSAYRGALIPEGSSGTTCYSPTVHVRLRDREDLDDWLRGRGLVAEKLILLRPCTRSPPTDGKSWPAANWTELCRRVQAHTPGMRLLLTGSPGEADLVAALRAQLAVEVETAAEDLPLRRLFALQERAFAMISLDTGPSHTAAALGCPVMIFYARAHPWEYRPPECVPSGAAPGAQPSPVIALKAREESQQAADISVEQAFDGWKRLVAAIVERQLGRGESQAGPLASRLAAVRVDIDLPA
ncbi:MAG TPA: glycosyltransferase family 9 protein [Steroidobacteraceae bacterium]|jgi:heptosyltransferase-2/heptosyltransferase-3|nr:glycosyltransferase family 9 protein [Steroidobacteraceae bacterium]